MFLSRDTSCVVRYTVLFYQYRLDKTRKNKMASMIGCCHGDVSVTGYSYDGMTRSFHKLAPSPLSRHKHPLFSIVCLISGFSLIYPRKSDLWNFCTQCFLVISRQYDKFLNDISKQLKDGLYKMYSNYSNASLITPLM